MEEHAPFLQGQLVGCRQYQPGGGGVIWPFDVPAFSLMIAAASWLSD